MAKRIAEPVSTSPDAAEQNQPRVAAIEANISCPNLEEDGGAIAFQVGIATFLLPTAMVSIIDGLARFCERRDMARVTELVGAIETEEADETDHDWVDDRE